MRRPGARHRRQPGAGRLADPAQPRVHRRRGGTAHPAAAHRHGQARDHRAGRGDRHLRGLDRARRRLLHALRPAASGHAHEPRGGRRPSSGGSTCRPSWRWASTGRWRRTSTSRRGPGRFPRTRHDRGPGRSRCRSERDPRFLALSGWRAAVAATAGAWRSERARPVAVTRAGGAPRHPRPGARAPRPVLPARGRDRSGARAPARSGHRGRQSPERARRPDAAAGVHSPNARPARQGAALPPSGHRAPHQAGRGDSRDAPPGRRGRAGGQRGHVRGGGGHPRPGRGDPDLPRGREPARAGADAAPHGRRAHAAGRAARGRGGDQLDPRRPALPRAGAISHRMGAGARRPPGGDRGLPPPLPDGAGGRGAAAHRAPGRRAARPDRRGGRPADAAPRRGGRGDLARREPGARA